MFKKAKMLTNSRVMKPHMDNIAKIHPNAKHIHLLMDVFINFIHENMMELYTFIDVAA